MTSAPQISSESWLNHLVYGASQAKVATVSTFQSLTGISSNRETFPTLLDTFLHGKVSR